MKSKEASVAVLLAAYNGASWIEEQISSILCQENVDIEIFISVDLSDDNTYKLCQGFAKNSRNIRVLPYGERFGGAAKNFFRLIRDVDFSNYDYISLSDQDDIWNCNKLSHAVKVIRQENLCGYSSNAIAFWDNGQEKLVKKSFSQKKFDYFFEAAGPGCTYVLDCRSAQKFKEFLIKDWGRIRSVKLHDWMIYAYFRSQNMKWEVDSIALIHYRQHESNQVGINYGLSAYLSRFDEIITHRYRLEVQKIIDLLSENSSQKFTLNRFFLIKNFWNLRRRPRDAIFLLLTIIFGIF